MKIFRILGKKGRVTIPYEIRKRVGFTYNDVLSFCETDDGHSVIVKREKICNKCNENKTDNVNEITLLDFLNDLTPSQQKAAFLYLSNKCSD